MQASCLLPPPATVSDDAPPHGTVRPACACGLPGGEGPDAWRVARCCPGAAPLPEAPCRPVLPSLRWQITIITMSTLYTQPHTGCRTSCRVRWAVPGVAVAQGGLDPLIPSGFLSPRPRAYLSFLSSFPFWGSVALKACARDTAPAPPVCSAPTVNQLPARRVGLRAATRAAGSFPATYLSALPPVVS